MLRIEKNMQLLLQTFVPQTSSQSVSNKEIVKQVQNDAANSHRTVRAHPGTPQPHTNSSPQSCATQSSWRIHHASSILHIAKRFAYPTIEAKLHHSPLDSNSGGNLDQALIRSALQLCNKKPFFRKKRAFSSESVCGIQDLTAARNAKEKYCKKRGRQQER